MSAEASGQISRRDRAEAAAVLMVILILGMTWLGLIWTETVDLRNGDYSARVMLVQHISLNPASAIWDVGHFIWPPLPFWIYRLLWIGSAVIGLDNADFIRCVLSLSALLAMASLYLVHRIARHFAPAPAGLLAVLVFASLTFLHVVATSALSQAIATPLLLLATFVYVRRIDAAGQILGPAFLFLLVSLARTDSVFYSGALSLILLYQGRWRDFLLFNVCSALFFLAHQAVLLLNGSFNYFDPSHYYDFTQETFQTQFHFLLLQSRELLGLESARPAGLVMALLVTCALAVSISIALLPRYRNQKSRFVFLLFVFALLFLFLSPFIAGNVRGRHARDAIYAAAILSAAFGIGLRGIVVLLGGHTRACLFTTVLFAGILSMAAARAAYNAIDFRQVPEATAEVRQWLEARLKPEDGVIFEGPWSEYLSAHLTNLDHPRQHWSFARCFFTFETKRDPILDRYALVEEGWRRLCTLSAAGKIAAGEARYIVTTSTGPADPDDWGAIRQGFLFPHLEGTGARRLLRVPPILPDPVPLEKRFDSKNYVVWEVTRNHSATATPGAAVMGQ